MRRLKNMLLISVFVLWILPLGFFIKPTEEKKVCDGQRAICLCTKAVKTETDAGKKILLSYLNRFENETPPSGANGTNFLAATYQDIHSLVGNRFFNYSAYLYFFVICKSIEHVPKAT